MKIFLTILLVFNLLLACKTEQPAANYSNRQQVKENLETITRGFGYRDYLNVAALNKVAAFIHSELSKYCDTVFYQEFKVNGTTYKNVIASQGTKNDSRIIIGAHYDVCGKQEGADDNASGIAGLLELARLLKSESLNYRIDFVAYTLEEPPFFGTKQMGSYVHAKSVFEEKQIIKGMICLEMIGYYSEAANSQRYPVKMLKPIYGDKGDYITIVEKFGSGRFCAKIEKLMKKHQQITTKTFKGPKKLQGIDFSDHRNYWAFGYDALMITNTAFYRNPNYHEISDKLETLDVEKMCRVIDGLYLSIKNFD